MYLIPQLSFIIQIEAFDAHQRELRLPLYYCGTTPHRFPSGFALVL